MHWALPPERAAGDPAMSTPADPHADAIRFATALPGLLDEATLRLRRQKRYAHPLELGGRRAANIEKILKQATNCVASLARPEVVLLPVAAEAVGTRVRIGGRVGLDAADIARDVARGGTVTAYLLTLNFDQRHAFDWLAGDYAAHHVQTELASEVLFALGRLAFRYQRDRLPQGWHLRRVTVQTSDICGQRRLWDPVKVQALLGMFDGANPGVSVTETGCFQPLNALLGLTVAVCPESAQGRVSLSSNIRP